MYKLQLLSSWLCVRKLSRFFVVIWLCSILATCILSLLPTIQSPVTFWNSDKIYHMLFYTWLSALPFLAFSRTEDSAMAAMAMLYLGITLECLQAFIPGRCFSLADILANGLGIILGAFLGNKLRARVQQTH